jgi:hypothetical protein
MTHLLEIEAQLAATPALLDAWLRPLPPGWTARNEGDNTWSPFDVVGHLIHGEKADWIPRLRIILEHGERQPFEPFDRFAQFKDAEGKTLGDLLDEFSLLRAQSLASLRRYALTDADLERPGTHPALGRVTVRQLLTTWMVHDLDHVTQIARVLAHQYRDDVGPWRAYLRVISGTQG